MPSSDNRILSNQNGLRQGRAASLAFFIDYRFREITAIISLMVVTGLAYGNTLASGLTWANGGTDGGDLISAAATHGIAHPGGYPLYLLLARFFQSIIPGDLAFRTNVMSAIFTMAAVLLVYRTALRLLSDKPFSKLSAWSSALAFGIAPLVWSQAVITEVYALQSLLTALILYQSLSEDERLHNDLTRGITVGLSMGNHMTSVFLIPLHFWKGRAFCQDMRSHIFRRLGGVVIGTSIYALLPVWASGNPPINWGNPVTLPAFFDLVTGRIYQSGFTTMYALDRLRGLAGIMINQVGLIGLFIGAFHLFSGWKQLKETALLPWIFLTSGIFSLFYGTIDSFVYLLPSVMVLCLWIAAGLQEIFQMLSTRWKNAWIAFMVPILILIGWQVYQTAPQVDASQDSRAEEYGQELMRTLPENAIVLTEDDESTFTLWYFHFALKQRPDLAVVSTGLLRFGWYLDTLRATYPNLSVPVTVDSLASEIKSANPSRPACELINHQMVLPECPVVPP